MSRYIFNNYCLCVAMSNRLQSLC